MAKGVWKFHRNYTAKNAKKETIFAKEVKDAIGVWVARYIDPKTKTLKKDLKLVAEKTNKTNKKTKKTTKTNKNKAVAKNKTEKDEPVKRKKIRKMTMLEIPGDGKK